MRYKRKTKQKQKIYGVYFHAEKWDVHRKEQDTKK